MCSLYRIPIPAFLEKGLDAMAEKIYEEKDQKILKRNFNVIFRMVSLIAKARYREQNRSVLMVYRDNGLLV